MASKIKKDIILEINDCPFYFLILDTTQFITKKEQLSLVFRYVSILSNDASFPTKLKIPECFLGFLHASDCSAEGLQKTNISISRK